MARSCTGANQISGSLDVLAASSAAFTIGGWLRRDATVTSQLWGFLDTTNSRLGFSWFTDNNIYSVVENASPSYGSINSTVTGWHHLCMVFDGSGLGNSARLIFYLDGVAQTLTFAGTIPATSSASPGVFRTQATSGTAGFAELAMWNASLNSSEVASLAKGFASKKIRPSKLVSYIPLVRNVNDLKSGIILTDSSTTVSDHPRIL